LAQPFVGNRPNTALALHGLDQNRGRILGDSGFDGGPIVERYLVETLDLGPEAFEIFGLATGSDRRERPPVECPFEGDDAEPLALPARMMITACGLDCAFQCFGAGIREEGAIREGRLRQATGQPLLPRNLVEIGQVPQFVGLLLERGDEVGMRMPKRIHRDAGGKIQISLAVLARQPDAVAALEAERSAVIGLEKRRRRCHLAQTPTQGHTAKGSDGSRRKLQGLRPEN